MNIASTFILLGVLAFVIFSLCQYISYRGTEEYRNEKLKELLAQEEEAKKARIFHAALERDAAGTVVSLFMKREECSPMRVFPRKAAPTEKKWLGKRFEPGYKKTSLKSGW